MKKVHGLNRACILMAMTAASTAVADTKPDCAEPIGPDAALNAGVSAIYASHSATTYANPEGGTFESVVYNGPTDFLVRNPDCCTFTLRLEDGFAPTPEWREKHSFYGFVTATFKAYRFGEGYVTREVGATRAVVVTTCGTTIWYNMDHDNW
jgi:hypothetical protein